MRRYRPVKEVLLDAMEMLEKRQSAGQRITGVPTGFAPLDDKTSGLQPGDFVVVAGRPSMGKTALVLNIAINAARRICDHAQADQILVSDVVRQLVAGSEFAFTDCGDFPLKGLEGLYRLHAVRWEDEGA